MGIFNATSTYGRGFKPTTANDQYSIRIYVGGIAGPKSADKRAQKEINNFMKSKEYSSFTILNRYYNLIPSYYEYTVQFSRA
jgi:hypothetical protein